MPSQIELEAGEETAESGAADDAARTLTDLIDDIGRDSFLRALERRPLPAAAGANDTDL